MDLVDRSFLVIGGAGFIGSHIVEQLLNEPVSSVTIYDNFARGKISNIKKALTDPRCRVFDIGGDILHQDTLNEAMKDVDGVFHLAALWLLHCHEYPDSAFEVNIRGTYNVIQAAIKQKVKRLIYSSSASVYGNALEIPMTEEHAYNNETFYGATKIAGEHMLKSLGSRYDLDWAGLRYMNVYGARQDYKGAYVAVMHKILDRLDEGRSPVVFGDGSQQYDFIYVDDVARANVCAMKTDISGQNYNVGTGIGTSIKDLTTKLLELRNSDAKLEFKPAGQNFVTSRIGSIEKAKRDLKFEATVTLEEGLKRLVEWRDENKKMVEEGLLSI